MQSHGPLRPRDAGDSPLRFAVSSLFAFIATGTLAAPSLAQANCESLPASGPQAEYSVADIVNRPGFGAAIGTRELNGAPTRPLLWRAPAADPASIADIGEFVNGRPGLLMPIGDMVEGRGVAIAPVAGTGGVFGADAMVAAAARLSADDRQQAMMYGIQDIGSSLTIIIFNFKSGSSDLVINDVGHSAMAPDHAFGVGFEQLPGQPRRPVVYVGDGTVPQFPIVANFLEAPFAGFSNAMRTLDDVPTGNPDVLVGGAIRSLGMPFQPAIWSFRSDLGAQNPPQAPIVLPTGPNVLRAEVDTFLDLPPITTGGRYIAAGTGVLTDGRHVILTWERNAQPGSPWIQSAMTEIQTPLQIPGEITDINIEGLFNGSKNGGFEVESYGDICIDQGGIEIYIMWCVAPGPPVEAFNVVSCDALFGLDVRRGGGVTPEGLAVFSMPVFGVGPEGEPVDRPRIVDLRGAGTPPCPADLDGDGQTGFSDVLEVLAAFGPCPGCPADLDGDGTVAFADLLVILAAFGPCP
ncbi:MAG: hypothetical protein AB8G96_08220 [Phycisphaerales bacterium]